MVDYKELRDFPRAAAAEAHERDLVDSFNRQSRAIQRYRPQFLRDVEQAGRDFGADVLGTYVAVGGISLKQYVLETARVGASEYGRTVQGALAVYTTTVGTADGVLSTVNENLQGAFREAASEVGDRLNSVAPALFGTAAVGAIGSVIGSPMFALGVSTIAALIASIQERREARREERRFRREYERTMDEVHRLLDDIAGKVVHPRHPALSQGAPQRRIRQRVAEAALFAAGIADARSDEEWGPLTKRYSAGPRGPTCFPEAWVDSAGRVTFPRSASAGELTDYLLAPASLQPMFRHAAIGSSRANARVRVYGGPERLSSDARHQACALDRLPSGPAAFLRGPHRDGVERAPGARWADGSAVMRYPRVDVAYDKDDRDEQALRAAAAEQVIRVLQPLSRTLGVGDVSRVEKAAALASWLTYWCASEGNGALLDLRGDLYSVTAPLYWQESGYRVGVYKAAPQVSAQSVQAVETLAGAPGEDPVVINAGSWSSYNEGRGKLRGVVLIRLSQSYQAPSPTGTAIGPRPGMSSSRESHGALEIHPLPFDVGHFPVKPVRRLGGRKGRRDGWERFDPNVIAAAFVGGVGQRTDEVQVVPLASAVYPGRQVPGVYRYDNPRELLPPEVFADSANLLRVYPQGGQAVGSGPDALRIATGHNVIAGRVPFERTGTQRDTAAFQRDRFDHLRRMLIADPDARRWLRSAVLESARDEGPLVFGRLAGAVRSAVEESGAAMLVRSSPAGEIWVDGVNTGRTTHDAEVGDEDGFVVVPVGPGLRNVQAKWARGFSAPQAILASPRHAAQVAIEQGHAELLPAPRTPRYTVAPGAFIQQMGVMGAMPVPGDRVAPETELEPPPDILMTDPSVLEPRASLAPLVVAGGALGLIALAIKRNRRT